MTLFRYIVITLFASAFVLIGLSCSNPYVNPQTSKAVSEAAQLEEMKTQSALMLEQNKQLKRIADGLVGKDSVYFKQPHK